MLRTRKMSCTEDYFNEKKKKTHAINQVCTPDPGAAAVPGYGHFIRCGSRVSDPFAMTNAP